MNKQVKFLTVLIVVVGLLLTVMSFVFFQPTQRYIPQGNGGNGSTTSSSGNNSQGTSKNISLAELAKHNTESDCWVGYQGKAYDLTSWLPRHPGSAGAIAPYCGTSEEFQNAFAQQHGTRMAALFMKVSIYEGDLS